MNYYNEFEPKTAAWLRQLIKDGLIPEGHVDERSIVDVQPDDLRGYTQCHFFAGIGGWPYALQLAGWPADRPVWTGSCPCQPFSAAGKRKGTSDPRHLWPEFYRLIRQCRPATVFGEQVASKDGRAWLDGVFVDLEAVAYATAGADLCAAGVGAPHIRQRLFWVADSRYCGFWRWAKPEKQELSEIIDYSLMGEPNGKRLEGPHENRVDAERVHNLPSEPGRRLVYASSRGLQQSNPSLSSEQYDKTSHWSDKSTIQCADGKTRRLAPGVTTVAHGIPERVVRLRGYGNAIVPQVAAEFVAAYMEIEQ